MRRPTYAVAVVAMLMGAAALAEPERVARGSKVFIEPNENGVHMALAGWARTIMAGGYAKDQEERLKAEG